MDHTARVSRSNHAREGVGLGRVSAFAAALASVSVGLWLLYRNLIYGDAISVTIILLSVLMICGGLLMLAPASDGQGKPAGG
jgi:hypothetical protein